MAGIAVAKPGPLLLITAAIAFCGASLSWAQSGAEDFKTACAACHTIGGGRVIGPDLSGVQDRRSQEWLVRFVTSSQSLIADGDPDAVALFEEYNGMIMPPPGISENRIVAVLAYIAEQSTTTAGLVQAVETAPAEYPVPEPEQIVLGQQLFQGTVRFGAGGPTCNACHHVKNDAVIGGGILARELTTVFSTMGREGVSAILGRAPFPVMQAAYEKQPLSDQEIAALVAFLQDADSQHAYQQPRDYGVGLLSSGVVGSLVVFGVCGLVWRGRRKVSVNQEIYDRQTKSI
jgi:mono/diheme cytochrome c family protein